MYENVTFYNVNVFSCSLFGFHFILYKIFSEDYSFPKLYKAIAIDFESSEYPITEVF